MEVFIPHGMRCEADHDYGGDFGRCERPAVNMVTHKGLGRYVCQSHFDRYQPEVQRILSTDAGDTTQET